MSRGGSPVPVLLLGGQENALSLARSLSGRGLTVGVAAAEDCWALSSRHVTHRYPIPADADPGPVWHRLLVDRAAPELDGAVVFPCSDPAMEFVERHRAGIETHFRLDGMGATPLSDLLDKSRTLELARAAGVPAPRHWTITAATDLDALVAECAFPVAVKPVHSHRFQRHFVEKLWVVEDEAGLRSGLHRARARGLEVIVTEWIPGGDDQLNSYYTYIGPDDEYLFHFTKRIIRRSPTGWGRGVYHVTEWLPETADAGRRFLRGIGFRGLANVEFKRDPRDGRLKLIECNARFTAAQEILVRAGLDIGWIIYRHLIGAPVKAPAEYREGVRLWHPVDDFDAFREMRGRGELSFAGWVRSVARRQSFPYLRLDDPGPALRKGWSTFGRRVLGRFRDREGGS